MKIGLCKCGCGNKTPISKRNRYNLGHIKGCHIDYLKGHKMRGIFGENHYNWKGDKAGYKAFHLRVNKIRGKAIKCEFCGSSKFVEWASLTKHYENIFDYKALCRKCHHKLDNKTQKAIETRKPYQHEIALRGWVTRRAGDVSA